MKHKSLTLAEIEKMTEEELWAVVASQIKGRSLFPKKVEEARKIMSRARFVNKTPGS